MYRASEWDSALVLDIEARLDAPVPGIVDLGPETTGLAIYNGLGACLFYGLDCGFLTRLGLDKAAQTTAAMYAYELMADFAKVTDKWDGLGELNTNPAEVTHFAAVMKQLPSEGYKVDFFFDKDFSLDNEISKYSREIIFWGSPVANPKFDAVEELKCHVVSTVNGTDCEPELIDDEDVSREIR